MAKTYYLMTPNHKRIVGTYEVIIGTGEFTLSSNKRKGKNKEFDLEWTGDTEVSWDSQETFRDHAGERVFFDEDGDTWPESKLTAIMDEDDDED